MSTGFGDGDRRHLLQLTDGLLERIEQLRLDGRVDAPKPLRRLVDDVAAEIDARTTVRTPATLSNAHDHVLRLQRTLLRRSGEPRPSPRLDVGRELSIPARGPAESEAAWFEQVRLVVQRAHDAALYLYAQAQAARRQPGAVELAERRGAQATRAHESFRLLSREAERSAGRAVTLDSVSALPTSGRLQLADLAIDVDAGEVRRAGDLVPLTRYEFTCLTALAANPDRVLTREALQHLVAGDKPTLDLRSRTIDVHIARLRSKLGPYYIETIAGAGHRASTRLVQPPDAGLDAARERRRAARLAWARGSSASPMPTGVASLRNMRHTRR